MFTGIIEEIGIVQSVRKVSEQAVTLSITATKILEDVHLGDSISVNGICLTVTKFTASSFDVDAMPETLKSTSLKDLRRGSRVNLERAMAANGRFGGHFVSGHIDGTGEIIKKQKEQNAIYYDIKVPMEFSPYLLQKGSITVDGTSLTIFQVKDNVFTISLIPHTVQETILGEKGVGDIVNIECDLLAKYMEKLMHHKQPNPNGMSKDFLTSNGFI